MDKQIQAISDDLGRLAVDARALMTATADVAGEKVEEARQRLAATLERCQERSQEIYSRTRAKVVAGTQAADEAVREHPYQAIGIAFGVGMLIGCLASRRCCGNDH
jgi:ElaB/YqjD/DUF883 family membrane-anchored ribosome-binding protein